MTFAAIVSYDTTLQPPACGPFLVGLAASRTGNRDRGYEGKKLGEKNQASTVLSMGQWKPPKNVGNKKATPPIMPRSKDARHPSVASASRSEGARAAPARRVLQLFHRRAISLRKDTL